MATAEATGRTALVWGATGGIGRAVVERLLVDGWSVSAVGRDARALPALTPHCYEADLSDAFSVQQAVMAMGQELGEIALFVYAAGDITSEPLAQMKPATWQRIMDANLTGAYLATHYSLPLLAEDAALVFVGAISERLRLPGLTAYVAAKAGLEAMVEALRKEERHRRVILVRPAAVNTGFWAKVPFRMPATAQSARAVAEKIVEAGRSAGSVVIDV
jgi:NAD(P)-dependent dehydrogenase (short-subunit alcohol dehydrogenase family)